jgi:hypothetical protein
MEDVGIFWLSFACNLVRLTVPQKSKDNQPSVVDSNPGPREHQATETFSHNILSHVTITHFFLSSYILVRIFSCVM